MFVLVIKFTLLANLQNAFNFDFHLEDAFRNDDSMALQV